MKRIAVLLVLLMSVGLFGTAVAEQNIFFNLGFAGASATYPDLMQKTFDDAEDIPGVSRIQIGIDLGLYFRMNRGSVFGISLNGIADRLEQDSDHVQVNQYLYAASYRYYLSRQIGRGFFLRGDVGLARMVADISGLGTATSDMGSGFLFGGGYSWQISGGTWFSVNADLTAKTIEDENYGGVTVGAAFLF